MTRGQIRAFKNKGRDEEHAAVVRYLRDVLAKNHPHAADAFRHAALQIESGLHRYGVSPEARPSADATPDDDGEAPALLAHLEGASSAALCAAVVAWVDAKAAFENPTLEDGSAISLTIFQREVEAQTVLEDAAKEYTRALRERGTGPGSVMAGAEP